MRKLFYIVATLALAATVGFTVQAADGPQTFKGEIIDLPCYVAQGAQGADHAGCAKACVKNGQPMGVKTANGLYLLAADHKNGDAYESLKEKAGEVAEFSGVLAEKDGMKVITVTGAAG